jgi:hypothetical protein
MTRIAWLGVVLLIAATAGDAQPASSARPDLEVVLMVDGGRTSEPHLWLLRVGFDGEIEGGGDLNPGLPAPPKKLTPTAHARLEALLDKERFFDRAYHNSCPPDLGGRVISAWRGTKQRSVSFCDDRLSGKRSDAQSWLRVWYGVLSIVSDGKRVPIADAYKRLLAK